MNKRMLLNRFLKNSRPQAGDQVEIIDSQHFLYGELATVISVDKKYAILRLRDYSETLNISLNQIACGMSLEQLAR